MRCCRNLATVSRKSKTIWRFAEIVAKCYENSLKFPKAYNLFIIQCILSIHSLALPPVQLRRGLRRRRAGDGQREGVDELRQVPAEARVLVRVRQGLRSTYRFLAAKLHFPSEECEKIPDLSKFPKILRVRSRLYRVRPSSRNSGFETSVSEKNPTKVGRLPSSRRGSRPRSG